MTPDDTRTISRETQSSPPTTAPAARSPAEVRREMLAKRLAMRGRGSMYDNLGLAVTADDATVAATVARLREEETGGRILSAEERYALQMLGTVASREAYDRSLLEKLDQMEEVHQVAAEDHGSGRRPLYLGVVLAGFAIAAFALHSHNQEQARRELAAEAARAREQAARMEAEARQKRDEMERAAAEEATQRVAEESRRRQDMQQQLVDSQTRARAAQVELQRDQFEERKKQAAWTREQAEKQRKERQDIDNARRISQQAERDLCQTARRSGNAGQVMMWCK